MELFFNSKGNQFPLDIPLRGNTPSHKEFARVSTSQGSQRSRMVFVFKNLTKDAIKV